MLKKLMVTAVLCAATLSASFATVDISKFTKDELNQTIQYYNLKQKSFIFGTSGNSFFRNVEMKEDYTYFNTLILNGKSGEVSFFDSKKNLVKVQLKDGMKLSAPLLFITTDSYNYCLGLPYVYKNLGSGTIDSISPVSYAVKETSSGYELTISVSCKKDEILSLWGVQSEEQLVDLSVKNTAAIFSNYKFGTHSRITADGYFYKSPSTYSPSTQTSFWKIPSMYVANSLVKNKSENLTDILGFSLLEIGMTNLNNLGYVPSLPTSNWLLTDYNISGGFFDTRFNSDNCIAYIEAYKRFNYEPFKANYIKILNHYIEHSNAASIKTNNGGLLVWDYSDGTNKSNHVALNHQLSDIHALLLAYEVDKNKIYLNLANKLILGLEDVGSRWIMKNGNLEYAYMANGTMGLKDYPYLTYNDLFIVQNDLMRLGLNRNEFFDRLMVSKKTWMDKNNITDYMK